MSHHRLTFRHLLLRGPHHAIEWLRRIYSLFMRLAIGDAKPLANYENQLRGKRVALVGNAQSLLKTEFGSQIDSMDLVVRMNHGAILKPISQGRRTDVLAMSCRMSEADLLRQFDPAAIFWMTPRWWHIAPYSRAVMRRVSFYPRRDWERLSRVRLNGRRPSTGFMTAQLLMQLGASEVHLFGFDFGDTPTFYNAPDYQTPHDYAAEERHLRAQAVDGTLMIHVAKRKVEEALV